MDIAKKLSWEIVALNDRGNYEEHEMLAIEIAYGIALKTPDAMQFQTIMASIIKQVTSKILQSYLQKIVTRVTRYS